MDSSFGALDAFAFLVFAILIAVVVIVVVKLGQLPGRLARQWGHPQASAINAASWIGIATGGLLWPLAFIWAFMVPTRDRSAGLARNNPPPLEGKITAGKEIDHDRPPNHHLYRRRASLLFKVLRIKPTAFLIAGILVAGVLAFGGVVVAWTLSAPISKSW